AELRNDETWQAAAVPSLFHLGQEGLEMTADRRMKQGCAPDPGADTLAARSDGLCCGSMEPRGRAWPGLQRAAVVPGHDGNRPRRSDVRRFKVLAPGRAALRHAAMSDP